MPSHSEIKLLPYRTSQIYQLVADIEKYPEFLPWCRAARILSREGNTLTAELLISYKHLSERYTSRVDLIPPLHEHTEAEIRVSLLRGPFSHLTNNWKFSPEVEASRVDFFIDFAFRTRLLDALLTGFFDRATHKMVTAFTQRAEELYGK